MRKTVTKDVLRISLVTVFILNILVKIFMNEM